MTLIGWKVRLRLSLREIVPSQEVARRFQIVPPERLHVDVVGEAGGGDVTTISIITLW